MKPRRPIVMVALKALTLIIAIYLLLTSVSTVAQSLLIPPNEVIQKLLAIISGYLGTYIALTIIFEVAERNTPKHTPTLL